VLAALVVVHRWLGIAGCTFFVLWFASGLVMLYVGFPDLSGAERLRYRAPLDWRQVSITPDEAMHRLALEGFPRELKLEMSGDRPVYRIASSTGPTWVSAVDGQPIEAVDADAARDVAARALGESPGPVTTLEMDQWTVAGTFDGHRPLHRVTFADEPGTNLYVSSRSGEIVLDSTARERTWNWVGSVVHWIYFKDLRAHSKVWSQVVKWTSGVCIFVAMTGLWLGIERFRWRRGDGSVAITPFRRWMAWHHVAGLVGGIAVLTWTFSGWLSMGPAVPWNSKLDPERRAAGLAAYAGHSEPTFGSTLQVLHSLQGTDAREATFAWVRGKPQITLLDSRGQRRTLDAVTGEPRQWSREAIVAGAAGLVPGANLTSAKLLTQEDAYWHSQDTQRSLPILRLEFDDEERTWVHIDPASGRIAGWLQSGDRVHRWLFDALHTFDFGWLLAHDSVRLALIWILSIAGLVLSISGTVIGWRRLRA
jgi:hypothetical protein